MTRLRVAILCVLLLCPTSGWGAEPTCRAFGEPDQVGQLDHDDITEASGLAASRRHPGHFWTHNDSGGEPRLFLLDATGQHVAQVTLDDVSARDWEDIAVGPCSAGSQDSCVWVGDIGDNPETRTEVIVHRVPEPALPDERPAEVTVSEFETTSFRYPGGPRDAEALMVHPTSADMYIVEKTSTGDSKVFRARADTNAGPARLLEHVDTVHIEASTEFGRMITAGDIHPDGGEFTLRTYFGVYTFCATDDFGSAFAATPVSSPSPTTIQGEAIAYGLGDDSADTIWITSEGRNAPLFRQERAVENSDEADAGSPPADATDAANDTSDAPGDASPDRPAPDTADEPDSSSSQSSAPDTTDARDDAPQSSSSSSCTSTGTPGRPTTLALTMGLGLLVARRLRR